MPLRSGTMELRRAADVAMVVAATDWLRAGEPQADAAPAGALRIDEFRVAGFQGLPVAGLRACERPGASQQHAAMASSAPGWVSTGRTRKPIQQ